MLSALETARSVYTSTVGRVAEVGMTSVGEFVGCGEGGGVDEDDTAEGSCAITYGFGALDDLDLTCTRVVYFGSMVCAPALASSRRAMDFSLCACRWAVRKTVLCWVSELSFPAPVTVTPSR